MLFRCRHNWGFPRRWPEFEGQRNVDVQTCSKCGVRRVSPIQFGEARTDQTVPAPPRRAERFWKWMHNINS